ncbi:phosphoribosylglycinamide formyltransferase [Edaphobacter albus]|uniref:phosphoribosylglycinamide formyltransferase n=1 Tax=Edaphobacter sp. 4G125 TaxID=2763071 RepID=UPI0016488EB2|nr:phosphoribosylglycinamide formyltransferase [Edaphobacter sp. 4G125]QNI36801.1 phosphoribosylglycinamide formyltransferase [Edaphobacter sp. 4G125]
MHKLGILLSGRGSNFLAIHRAIEDGRIRDAEIAVVISNKPDAAGLEAAHSLGLNALAIPQEGKGQAAREAHDTKMIAALTDYGVDLVCLAGYMRIITPAFVEAFPNRILNVHPSLLPAFPGLDAQHQAFEYGAKVAGCTVHFVDEAVDHGVIILQKTVPVLDEDTAETLSARILEQEHLAYPEALSRVLSGKYHIVDRRYLPKS